MTVNGIRGTNLNILSELSGTNAEDSVGKNVHKSVADARSESQKLILYEELSISEEGRKALRESLHEIKPNIDEPEAYELTLQNTNELEWEHYTAMREIGAQMLEGDYDVKDVMQSIMEAYETRYNQIVKAHEKGDRQVTYELTGENSLTLEEDLAGLDRAYSMCLENLKGYIVCRQTSDGSEFFQSTNRKENEKERNEYRDTAVSMMEQAKKRFLELRKNSFCQAGTAKEIIWNIMHKNVIFMEKTQKLFEKTMRYNR